MSLLLWQHGEGIKPACFSHTYFVFIFLFHLSYYFRIWGCLYDPALPGRDMRRDDFDVLK